MKIDPLPIAVPARDVAPAGISAVAGLQPEVMQSRVLGFVLARRNSRPGISPVLLREPAQTHAGRVVLRLVDRGLSRARPVHRKYGRGRGASQVPNGVGARLKHGVI